MNKRETFRNRVYSYFKKNKKFGKKFTVDHFVSEGENKRTIYGIIKLYEAGVSVLDKTKIQA